MAGVKGWFNGEQLALAPGTLSELKSVALHELQHGIQRHEGFAYGASAEALTPERWKGLNAEFTAFRDQVESSIRTKLRDERVIPDIWEFKRAIKNEASLPKEGEKYSDWTSTWTKEENEKSRHLLKLSKELGIYVDLKKVVKGEDIKQNYENLLFQEYERVKGEVEARNVQTRKDMGYFDRFQKSPRSTEDTPRENQRWSPYDPSSMKDLSESRSASPIKSAAIVIDGKTYEGINHFDAMQKAIKEGNDLKGKIDSGFITQEGKFVDRDEAAKLVNMEGPLISEDVPHLGHKDEVPGWWRNLRPEKIDPNLP